MRPSTVCTTRQTVTASTLSVLLAASCGLGPSAKSKRRLAAVLGGAIGGAALLVVVIIVLLYVFRKRVPFFKHARRRGSSRSRQQRGVADQGLYA